jgi:hypothetical protein
MVIEERSTPVTYVSVEAAIVELRQTMARMERIYETSSETMLQAVRSGERVDTAEIALWLVQYRELQHLLSLS